MTPRNEVSLTPKAAKWTDKGNFRNAQGVRYLKELFYEQTLKDKPFVIYTLKDRDHKGYPSLYLRYLETADITEYIFANTYLEGWDHWTRLCKADWFKPYIARWREELSLKLESEILRNFQTIASTGAEGAFQANKILLDRVRKPKEGHGRGRPSQDTINAEKERLAQEERELALAYKRINPEEPTE